MKSKFNLLLTIVLFLAFFQWSVETAFSERKIDIKVQPHEVQQQTSVPTIIINAPIRHGIINSGQPGVGMPGSGTGESGMPGSGTGESGMPGSGAGESGMPGVGMPGSGAGESGMPGVGMPGSGAGESGMPGVGMPGSGAGESGMPGVGMPGSGVGENGTPGVGMPGSGVGEGGMPGSGVPGSGVGESGNPEIGIPESSLGEESEGANSNSSWTERIMEFGKDVFTSTKDFLLDSENLIQIGRGVVVGVIGAVAAGVLVAGAVALGVVAAPGLAVIAVAAVVAVAVGVTYSFIAGDQFSYTNGILASALGAFTVLTLGAMGAGALVRGAASVGKRLGAAAVNSVKATVTSKWFGLNIGSNFIFTTLTWMDGRTSSGFPTTGEIAGILGATIIGTLLFDKVGGAVKAAVRWQGAAGWSLKGAIDGGIAVVSQFVTNRLLRLKNNDKPLTAFFTGLAVGKVADRLLKSQKEKIGTTISDVKALILKPFQKTDSSSNSRTITNAGLQNITRDPSKINPNTMQHFIDNPRISQQQLQWLENNQQALDQISLRITAGEKLATQLPGILDMIDAMPVVEQGYDLKEEILKHYQNLDRMITEPLDKGVNHSTNWIENRVK